MQDNIKKAVMAVLDGMKISESAEKFDVERTKLGRIFEGVQLGLELAKETQAQTDCAQCAQKDAEIESLRAQLESLRADRGVASSGDPIQCPGLAYLTRAAMAGKAENVSCADVRQEWEKLQDILKEKDAEILNVKRKAYALMKRYNHLERSAHKLRFAFRQGQKIGIVQISDMKKFQELIDAV